MIGCLSLGISNLFLVGYKWAFKAIRWMMTICQMLKKSIIITDVQQAYINLLSYTQVVPPQLKYKTLKLNRAAILIKWRFSHNISRFRGLIFRPSLVLMYYPWHEYRLTKWHHKSCLCVGFSLWFKIPFTLLENY